MGNYWNERYGKGGKVWGDKPSGTAMLANDILKMSNVDNVLVIGSDRSLL